MVIGFALAPITYAVAPWYAIAEFNTFFPLIISYGGFILASILWGLGGLIMKK